MANILITGASGNIGKAIIQSFDYSQDHKLFAGIRGNSISDLPEHVQQIAFDFENTDEYSSALNDMDVVFLLRPPQLADVNKVFAPFILAAIKHGIKHVVFLSVQGAESMSYLPHSKIEKLIIESKIPYTFIRPGYFMQNLITTLKADIVDRHLIYLPAGNTLFNWTDVNDVGLLCAQVLSNHEIHRNKAYTITGNEQYSFSTVAKMISAECCVNISYYSRPGPIAYLVNRKRAGISISYILVMLLLHYLPRFSKQPPITDDFSKLTGRTPNTLHQFIVGEVKPYFT